MRPDPASTPTATGRPGGRTTVAYFVSPSRQFAGIERVVHEVATGLADEHGDQLDVHVIYSSAYADPELRSTSYAQHVLGVDRLRGLTSSVRRAVAQVRPDVLVVPQVEAAVIVWCATRGLRRPRTQAFVVHLHGNPRVEEVDGTRRTRAAFLVFRRVVAARLTAVFAVSPSLARAAAHDVARGRPVVYVPNPVRGFGGAPASAPRDGVLRLACVARLSHQKGQDLLLRALAVARPQLGPVQLTLVGDGPAEADLRRLCTELGLDDAVRFAGHTNDPAAILRQCHAFVLASRWEGFGVALVEALDLGLPLLATDCDYGPADIICSADIGELVPANDPAALAAGLVRLVGRLDDLSTPQAVAARRAVAAGHSRSSVTASHLTALREVLAAARLPRPRQRAATTDRGAPL